MYRVFRVKEHSYDNVVVIAKRGTLESPVIAAHLGRRLRNTCHASTAERIPPFRRELIGIVAGVANHGELELPHNTIRQHNTLRVDLDEVLSVANARPAAVMHVASGVPPSKFRQSESVTVVLARSDQLVGPTSVSQ